MQRIVIILAYLFFCTTIIAQQYPFVHYTPKDGLINSRVKKAYQDSKGRMYFLTYGGLSVYDGVRFKNYTTKEGLAVSLVNDILEVGDDSLLIASNNGNFLNVLVKGKMKFLKLPSTNIPLINHFYRHENGKIYLSSDDGLFILEKNNIRKLNTTLSVQTNTDLVYLNNITGVGNWLILSTNELNNHQSFYLYDIEKNRICDSLSKPVLLIGKDGRNRVWISMIEKLFILDSAALIKGRLLPVPPKGGYLQTKDYSAFNIAFGKNCIWIVHRDKGYKNTEIRRIDESGGLLKMPLPSKATSSFIKNILIDRENTIWLSNDGEGVFKMLNSPLMIFENLFGNSNKTFIDDAYYSDETTWYSTNTNKLFKKSKQGAVAFTSNLTPAPDVFYDNGKKLLAHDSRRIYEGIINSQKKSVNFHSTISVPGSDMWGKKLLSDPNGNLIAVQGLGMAVWRNNKQVFYLPLEKPDIIDDFLIDKDNLLWAIKRYSGIDVFRLHPESDSKYLELACNFPKDKIRGSPRSLVIDKTGLIWVGTRDDGLVCYQREDNNLVPLLQFDASNGLTDNFITTLACDSMNNIIVGTQTGLDRILRLNKNSYRVENLSKSSNFFVKINKTWSDSKRSYALSFSGFLLEISAPSQDVRSNNPQLLLEEMKVNTQSIATGKKTFKHKENNISFLVAAPSFIDEKQIVYTYLLEGSGNKQWSDTSAANAVINLTNLSPGKYNLKAKAFFLSTSYLPAELSYPFEINPPWWQTWWFRAMMSLLIIGLIIIGFKIYYRRKLEIKTSFLEKQQAIEKERTRIATDMHDDLGAGLSRIKFLTQSLLNKKKDDMINPELEKISAFSDEMSEKMGEIIWALNEKNDTLADLVAFTRSYTMEYLASHNIQCEADTPMNLPVTFLTGEMRRNIFLSVKECLHNVVKHSGATKVLFSVHLNAAMQIIVHDNGKGFNTDFQKLFRNGVQNIEKRMKEINGTVIYTNDAGTKVMLTIPINL
ncbi:MAG: hypothetical protein JSS80_01210 [Bacteroidetes bacterium]|nr:hypothetical protein [Bacteroidota bacterium]